MIGAADMVGCPCKIMMSRIQGSQKSAIANHNLTMDTCSMSSPRANHNLNIEQIRASWRGQREKSSQGTVDSDAVP